MAQTHDPQIPEVGRAAAESSQAHRALHGVHDATHEGVALVRDVASDTVRAVGEVGQVAVGTTRDLLVGLADGVRDVLTHIIPFDAISQMRHRERRPEEGEPKH